MAYTLQKLGQTEAAMKLYNQVMKQRYAVIVLLISVCSIRFDLINSTN